MSENHHSPDTPNRDRRTHDSKARSPSLSLYLYLYNQNQAWQSDFLPIRGPPAPMSELQLPNSITAPKVFQMVDLKSSRRSTTPSIPITGGSGKGADRRPRSAPFPNDRSLSSFLWMNQPTNHTTRIEFTEVPLAHQERELESAQQEQQEQDQELLCKPRVAETVPLSALERSERRRKVEPRAEANGPSSFTSNGGATRQTWETTSDRWFSSIRMRLHGSSFPVHRWMGRR